MTLKLKSKKNHSLKLAGLALIASTIIGCSSSSNEDPFVWLEEVEGEKSMAWVKEANQETAEKYENTELFKSLYQDALNALNNDDRLPNITLKGDMIYNYWKDQKNPRGLYRRTDLASFNQGSPQWETVLDIDAMSKADGVKWVFKGMDCLAPENTQCLVFLSQGGGDAVEMREFNSKSLTFIEDGFTLPEAKMRVSWMDKDHLFVGTNFGEGSLTDSGYPRIQKIWQRGTDLAKAKTVLEADTSSVWAVGRRVNYDGGHVDLLVEGLDFWTSQYYQLIDNKAVKLNIPTTAQINDVMNGQLVISLQQDWIVDGQTFKQGSVVMADPSSLTEGASPAIRTVIPAKRDAIVEAISVTPDGIVAVLLEDVKSKVYLFKETEGNWSQTPISFPENGTVTIETVNSENGDFYARYENFTTPPTLYFVGENLAPAVAVQQAATFDGSLFTSKQFFAESADGTQVPYFVVMSKDTKMNGENPTHIFSYGGFRASLTPSYSGSYEALNGAYGNMWLGRGGVFVLANIRGGAEYGPDWHAQALLENRTKAYEDFEAVAEDLIMRKITSPEHLGIEGRSNGGLLVGATMTRRPDLYGAVVCGVPLLDMKRYHTLLAGASWMAEYGNPDTSDWEFIKEYSPYQNLKTGVDYPETFFYTSTKDDRVHPGHARKMAAKMESMGYDVEYYENLEGGHGGSSTNEQLAKRIALSYTHLWTHLK